ncbi:MAG: thermonuclease family protein [Solirubrobacteraceae bacterium]|nr:thermonuclease family protein [Solirubrobacteraceae bacterium]
MSARRLVLVVLALAAAAAGGAGAGGVLEGEDDGAATAPGAGDVGRVVKVVDGDTIHVQLGAVREKVRYIGVDTPETKDPRRPVQCFGEQASQFNARLVGDERVRLHRDVEERDRYGRLLAYVHRVRDGLFVNAELARLGYAQPLTIAPNVRYADRFAALAREARAAGRGLWAAC